MSADSADCWNTWAQIQASAGWWAGGSSTSFRDRNAWQVHVLVISQLRLDPISSATASIVPINLVDGYPRRYGVRPYCIRRSSTDSPGSPGSNRQLYSLPLPLSPSSSDPRSQCCDATERVIASQGALRYGPDIDI